MVSHTLQAETKNLLRFIVIHSEQESVFLTPQPQHQINTGSLVDEIVKIWDLEKEEVSLFVDSVADGVESKNNES